MTGSILSRTARLSFVTATTTGSLAGVRHTALQYAQGSISGSGGYFYAARVGIGSGSNVGMKWFVGMYGTAAIIGNVNPSTLTNIIGFGKDAGDRVVKFYTNDGAGTATMTSCSLAGTFDATGSALTSLSELYDIRIFAPGSGTTVYASIEDVGGNRLQEFSASTDIPAQTTLLAPQIWIANASVLPVNTVAIEVCSQYIESDV
jgi:hypothetical protein